jgi:hypothetical protein
MQLSHEQRMIEEYGMNFTEQVEYEYIKSLNQELNLMTKNEYIKSEPIHKHFIEKPDIYFKASGVWTNWDDFLDVDTTIKIY